MLRQPHGRRKICSLTLLLSCLPATASAQSVPASSPQKLSLSLRQAVLLALKQNPQQLIALLQVQQSARDSQIARAPLLPQSNLYATGLNFCTLRPQLVSATYRLPLESTARLWPCVKLPS